MQQERFAAAQTVWERLLEDFPATSPDPHYQLAVCRARQGLNEPAVSALDASLARESNYPPALHLRAYLEFSAGRYREALGWAKRYLAIDPSGGETRKVSGLARFLLDDKQGAEDDLRLAVQKLPLDFDARYYLGRVYFEKSKLSLALESLRRAAAIDPGSVKARNHLGQTLEGLTRFADAEAAYRDAIVLEREGPERSEWPYFNLGALLLSRGEEAEAIVLLEQALARNPSSAQTRTKLGAAYRANGRDSDALEQFDAAVRAAPNDAEARYQLGLLLVKLGRQDEAREHLLAFRRLSKE